MITYLLWGLVWTLIIDWVLKGTEHELTNLERLQLIVIYPIIFVFLIWEVIKAFTSND
jgi:membrane protein DedA with SNARE-associated domain